MKNNTEYFDKRRKKIFAKKGGWKVGKGVTSHNYSLFDDLIGKVSYYQMLILQVTGTLPDTKLATWFDAVAISLSYPDVRIWTNTIGALGGTARTSSAAGITAGILAADSKMYGVGSLNSIIPFITKLKQSNEKLGFSSLVKISEEIKTKSKIFPIAAPGFVKPLIKGDERVPALLKLSTDLDFSVKSHLGAALEFEKIIFEKYGEQLNLGGYIVAFMLDYQFTANHILAIMALIVSGGVHASYIEYLESPPESLLPLRCDDMEYTGPPIKIKPEHLDPP
ncbi:MAG: hypothetical protein V4629_05200 [Pseudomonadota bacterium]